MFTNYKSGNKHHDFRANNSREWVYSFILLRLEGRGARTGLADFFLLVVEGVEAASAALAAFKASWKFL